MLAGCFYSDADCDATHEKVRLGLIDIVEIPANPDFACCDTRSNLELLRIGV